MKIFPKSCLSSIFFIRLKIFYFNLLEGLLTANYLASLFFIWKLISYILKGLFFFQKDAIRLYLRFWLVYKTLFRNRHEVAKSKIWSQSGHFYILTKLLKSAETNIANIRCKIYADSKLFVYFGVLWLCHSKLSTKADLSWLLALVYWITHRIIRLQFEGRNHLLSRFIIFISFEPLLSFN
jgi:hypothetical protein